MLDEHIGHMPHCTPSDLTPRNILKMGYNIDKVYLVTRAYQTRHGNGPMTNAQYPVKPINNEKETNTYDPYQGEFRTTVLDLDQLIHAKKEGIDKVIPKDTIVNLVVTCTDQVLTYQLTRDQEILTFDKDIYFASFIGNSLDINGKVYLNNSPFSDSISCIQ